MKPKFRPIAGLVLALLLVSPALAQGPVEPQHNDPFWQVSYWNNISLSGDPVVQTTDARLDWDWGSGSPHASVNADQFSARWARYIDVSPGVYRFITTSDDGIRVWVDGELIIDRWTDHPPTTYTAQKQLSEGHHLVKVEYYENRGGAVARLSWEQATDDGKSWRGEYFSNKTLSGSPNLVRSDPTIDFAWGSGSPAPGQIDADGFSVRWSRSLNLTAGNYRFRMTVDDGARLYVNGHLLIDAWKDQSPRTYSGDIYLPSGAVTVQMEYYENKGSATARLSWATVDESPILGWKGEYFGNTGLSGSPLLVRDDAAINFEWGSGSPAPGIVAADRFSVRWTRALDLSAGTYRFTARIDDGVRLYVNDRLLINAWKDQPPTTYTVDTYHSGGKLGVKMEYYENSGSATAKLSWQVLEPPSTEAVIVDDKDAGFVKGGSAAGWRTADEGYNGRLTWTLNNDSARSNYNWGRWYPDLAAGRYEVWVYIPDRYTTTASARYWVSHVDGLTLKVVDQSANGGRWVSLGTYRFQGTEGDYVSLNAVTYEANQSRLMAFDAAKWMPK